MRLVEQPAASERARSPLALLTCAAYHLSGNTLHCLLFCRLLSGHEQCGCCLNPCRFLSLHISLSFSFVARHTTFRTSRAPFRPFHTPPHPTHQQTRISPALDSRVDTDLTSDVGENAFMIIEGESFRMIPQVWMLQVTRAWTCREGKVLWSWIMEMMVSSGFLSMKTTSSKRVKVRLHTLVVPMPALYS